MVSGAWDYQHVLGFVLQETDCEQECVSSVAAFSKTPRLLRRTKSMACLFLLALMRKVPSWEIIAAFQKLCKTIFFKYPKKQKCNTAEIYRCFIQKLNEMLENDIFQLRHLVIMY